MFRCQLPITPKIGKRIDFPFLMASAGNGDKYVASISYKLAAGKVIVNVVPGEFSAEPIYQAAKRPSNFEGLTTRHELWA